VCIYVCHILFIMLIIVNVKVPILSVLRNVVLILYYIPVSKGERGVRYV
jgi:hypothetical protein